jgi:hypothetical protein
MLGGYTVPLSPLGIANLATRPRWHSRAADLRRGAAGPVFHCPHRRAGDPAARAAVVPPKDTNTTQGQDILAIVVGADLAAMLGPGAGPRPPG